MKHLISFVSLIVVLLVLAPRSAHAYLDPASGSMILQVIVAALVTALITLKAFWHKIRGMFDSDLTESDEDEEQG